MLKRRRVRRQVTSVPVPGGYQIRICRRERQSDHALIFIYQIFFQIYYNEHES
jgi:hypothetical protein